MSSTGHPSADLSAYLDGALGASEHARVDAHLAVCGECRRHLGELRAVASLVARLDDPVPSRSLVPRLGMPPVWLAPLRTVLAAASGAFVMVFVASVLLTNMTMLSRGGTTGASPAAAWGGAAAAPAPAAATSSLERSALAAADSAKQPTASASSQSSSSTVASGSPSPMRSAAPPAVPFGPWPWLGAAVLSAALAVALQRRLTH